LWVAAAAGFALIETLRSWSSGGTRVRAVAWAVPAVGVLLFLQLGFAPVTHSMARGSVEVVSASARGSIPAAGIDRVMVLATTFGLAALPLFALGLVGAVSALRRQRTADWR